MSAGKILIAGSLAQRPGIAGHAWVFLQYLLGFKRLGFDVVFLDWVDRKMCIDESGQLCPAADSLNIRHVAEVLKEHGLADAWSVDYNRGEQTFGLPRAQVLAQAKEADLLLNVMGFLRDTAILERTRRCAFLDIDPGFGQMWQELGLANLFEGHDAYVTIGENIHQDGCTIPTCGLSWVTTPQPIVLDRWPAQTPDASGAFTSIATWRGPFGPIEFKGITYGLRVHEFRKFSALPKRSSALFDLALEIDPSDAKDRALLQDNGWRLHPPHGVTGSTRDYQRFIQNSKAELMIAKNMYVATKGGWFSDRSICYLASAKPVLAQDTGFSRQYPTGQGLLTFTTLEEAAAGVEAICADYSRHARAARDLAETYFDSDKLLSKLLEKIR